LITPAGGALYIDGLQCSNFNRSELEELRRGGLTCVTPTLAFWEDAGETMDALGWWRDLARSNADLIVIARSADDIRAAHLQGRTAILLGTQNSSPIEDRLRYVELFHDMGLRVMQLTYNNQNAIGGSCYDPVDSGLSRFGREVVREMNRVGMIIDLSHVGEKTGMDALRASDTPVAINHANPISLYDHPRNKSDELLQALADTGGVLGLATYQNLNGPWTASIQTWVDLVRRTVDLMGIDYVALGTDFCRNTGDTELQWMRKGRWTRSEQAGAGSISPSQPTWMDSPANFPDLAAALARHGGFAEDEVAKIMGGNWMRYYEQVLI
jgi:membrane dipeptidase